jgi:hypothetical protein
MLTGVEVTIKTIRNHVARSHLRVLTTLVEENNPVSDDNGIWCQFNTTIHNPLDLKNKQKKAEK